MHEAASMARVAEGDSSDNACVYNKLWAASMGQFCELPCLHA